MKQYSKNGLKNIIYEECEIKTFSYINNAKKIYIYK